MSKRKALNKEEEEVMYISDVNNEEKEEGDLTFTQEEKDRKKVKLLTSEAENEEVKAVGAVQPVETRFSELPEELIFKILDFVSRRVDAFHFMLTSKQTFCLMPKVTSICKVFFPLQLEQLVNDYFDYFKHKTQDAFDCNNLRDMKDYNNSFEGELEQFGQFFELKKTEFKLQQLLHEQRHTWKRWLTLLEVSDSARKKIKTLLSTVEYLDFKESRLNGEKGFTFAKFKAAGDVFTIELFCDGNEETQVLFTWNEDLIGEGSNCLYFDKNKLKNLRAAWNIRELKKCEMLELLQIIIPLDMDELDIDVE
ncbi:hypothetical protein ABK040_005010 [Willaertia magna]